MQWDGNVAGKLGFNRVLMISVRAGLGGGQRRWRRQQLRPTACPASQLQPLSCSLNPSNLLQYGEDQEVKAAEHGDMQDPDGGSDDGPDY